MNIFLNAAYVLSGMSVNAIRTRSSHSLLYFIGYWSGSSCAGEVAEASGYTGIYIHVDVSYGIYFVLRWLVWLRGIVQERSEKGKLGEEYKERSKNDHLCCDIKGFIKKSFVTIQLFSSLLTCHHFSSGTICHTNCSLFV